jgi:hypothetical protein
MVFQTLKSEGWATFHRQIVGGKVQEHKFTYMVNDTVIKNMYNFSSNKMPQQVYCKAMVTLTKN